MAEDESKGIRQSLKRIIVESKTAIIGFISFIVLITGLIIYVYDPTFALAAEPSSLIANQNDTKEIALSINNEYSRQYNHIVNLSAIVEPPGSDIRIKFKPSDCQVPSNSTMELKIGPNIAKGIYKVTIMGKGGDNSVKSIKISLKIGLIKPEKHLINISCIDQVIAKAKLPYGEYNITNKDDALDLIRGEIDRNHPMFISSNSTSYLIVGYNYEKNNKIFLGLKYIHGGIEWMDYDKFFSKINNNKLYVIYETEDCLDSNVEVPEIIPMSLCMVLDRSGSMDSEYENVRKIERAKDAAIDVINMMMPQDKIALVSFSDTAKIDAKFGCSFQLAEDKIKNLHPGGETSFGAGLEAALGQFDSLGVSNNIRAILFLSDGEHNKKPDPDEYIARCREKGITIFTIGFGPDESKVGGELLEYMARSTNGTYRFEKDVIDLGNTFIEQKENASSGLILNKSEGYISQGEILYTEPYNIGAYEYLKVILNWPGSDLDLTLIDPDGNEINSSIPGVYYSGNET